MRTILLCTVWACCAAMFTMALVTHGWQWQQRPWISRGLAVIALGLICQIGRQRQPRQEHVLAWTAEGAKWITLLITILLFLAESLQGSHRYQFTMPLLGLSLCAWRLDAICFGQYEPMAPEPKRAKTMWQLRQEEEEAERQRQEAAEEELRRFRHAFCEQPHGLNYWIVKLDQWKPFSLPSEDQVAAATDDRVWGITVPPPPFEEP